MPFRLNILPFSIEAEALCAEHTDFCESVLSQGNGCMGVRGFDPFRPQRNTYDKSVFIAGCFDYIKPGITDMVNTPDLFYARLHTDCRVLSAKARMDMKTGVLTHVAVYQYGQDTRFTLTTQRVLSMAQVHAAAMRVEIAVESGMLPLLMTLGLNSDVKNLPISDDQMAQNHAEARLLEPVLLKNEDHTATLVMESAFSHRSIAQCAHIACPESIALSPADNPAIAGFVVCGNVSAPACITLDQVIATYTYRDDAEDVLRASQTLCDALSRQGFDSIRRQSAVAFEKIWADCDIKLDAEDALQDAVRYNIFLLIQNNAAGDAHASIGARGLMRGRYKGNYFWDTELFMLPFYQYTQPERAKNLLLYRYHTLPDAVEGAKGFGLKGARYPWMCSDTGREQCETWDTGCCEIHITADIAYAIVQYVRVTGDIDFMRRYGLEMLGAMRPPSMTCRS